MPTNSPLIPPDRLIRKSDFKELTDPVSNAVVALAIETAKAGYGALIFCRSRQRCQVTALLVSRAMPDDESVAQGVLEKRREIVSELRNLSVELDDELAQIVVRGVAFHRMYSAVKLVALLTQFRRWHDYRRALYRCRSVRQRHLESDHRYLQSSSRHQSSCPSRHRPGSVHGPRCHRPSYAVRNLSAS